jgi:hypothetical protein
VVVVSSTVVVVSETVDVVVVVSTDGPYDQTYSSPGSPLRHASQSVHVGYFPA